MAQQEAQARFQELVGILPSFTPYPATLSATGKSRLGEPLGLDLKPLDKYAMGRGLWEVTWDLGADAEHLSAPAIQQRVAWNMWAHWPDTVVGETGA